MKKVFIIFLLINLGACVEGFTQGKDSTRTSQESTPKMETLLGKTTAFGGFIGLHSKIAQLDGKENFLIGGSAGILLNHSLGIGVAGYGLIANEWRKYHYLSGQFREFEVMEMGYGGILLEPVILPHKVVHLTTPILVGAGGVGVIQYEDLDFDGEVDVHLRSGTAFFVIEPGIGIQLSLTNFIRIDLGINYRYVPDIFDFNQEGINNLSGVGGVLSLKLGWF